MSLVVGQRMVRADDGMRGVVELVAMPGFEQYEELRIVYIDRGEKRLAGKREVWNVDAPPPRTLREEEIQLVAAAADMALRSVDRNEPLAWWKFGSVPNAFHDPELVALITEHLRKRG